MKNFAQFMKQAQTIQKQISDAQAAIEKLIVEGESGAGLVQISVDGKGHVKSIRIDPSLAKADEVEVLEDLIVAAYNDAKSKADQKASAEMEKAGAGMGLPAGLNFPF